MEKLQSLLNNHDWFYLRSDDHRKYLRGKSQRNQILLLASELGQEGLDLYNQTYKQKHS